MGDRRMFTKKVTDDDRFMNLSASAQALYLHLSMSADDDGFCNQVSVAMFKSHASVQDLEALLNARYVYQFESGVIVIKHWRMANALRKDRYTPTTFKNELAMLQLDENGSYTMHKNDVVADWLPSGCQMVAPSKDKLSKDKLSKDNVINAPKRFVKPSLQQCIDYINENNLNVDANKFIDYYNMNGWKVGRNSMKDWKAALRNWSRNQYGNAKTTKDVVPAKSDDERAKERRANYEKMKKMLEE